MVTAEPAWERALDRAWERALELAWESFCGGTTPVGAVVTDAAGAIVTEGRGRRFELLHISWIMRAAGPHVLAAQQQALPALTALAARPATHRLRTEAATARTPLPDLRSALQGKL